MHRARGMTAARNRSMVVMYTVMLMQASVDSTTWHALLASRDQHILHRPSGLLKLVKHQERSHVCMLCTPADVCHHRLGGYRHCCWSRLANIAQKTDLACMPNSMSLQPRTCRLSAHLRSMLHQGVKIPQGADQQCQDH